MTCVNNAEDKSLKSVNAFADKLTTGVNDTVINEHLVSVNDTDDE